MIIAWSIWLRQVILEIKLHDSINLYADIPTDGTVNYFLSGMGAECCYFPLRKHSVPEGKAKQTILHY
jgi:hypothetical protein